MVLRFLQCGLRLSVPCKLQRRNHPVAFPICNWFGQHIKLKNPTVQFSPVATRQQVATSRLSSAVGTGLDWVSVDEIRQFNPREQPDDITLIVAKCRESLVRPPQK